MCTIRRIVVAALCCVMGLQIVAQAIPDKIYVDHYRSDKRVDVINGNFVDSITVKLGVVKLMDSMHVHLSDGTMRGFRIRSIDSITIDEPRDVMLKELSYYNKVGNGRIPIYADSYVNVAGWSNRSKWNLANVHDPTVVKAGDGYY